MNGSLAVPVRRCIPRVPMPAALLMAVVVTVVISAPPAAALFSGSRSAAHTISSATLAPASNLSATTSCDPLLSLTARATVSWTATPSMFAAGYTVERWRGSTLQSTTTVTPRTATSITQTGLATGTTYTWRVRAFVSSWTSTVVSTTATTPALCL